MNETHQFQYRFYPQPFRQRDQLHQRHPTFKYFFNELQLNIQVALLKY